MGANGMGANYGWSLVEKERKREIIEIVVDRYPEARNYEVVRRHVLRQSLQQCQMKQMILPRRPVENELTI